ncbi:MAG: hypothetical protein E2590_07265 [Chryseobacterium sp.]|nr:hypothetical protein [Chryseobacterium sp.]
MIDSALVIKSKCNKANKFYIINSDNSPYITKNSNLKGLETIDIYDKKNKNLLKKGIGVWKVFPSLNSNLLKIKIIEFAVYYKSDNYDFSNNGGSTTVFEYSCKDGIWKLLSTENSGI